MGVFEQFPYTNFHDLNLDWIMKTVKADDAAVHALGEWSEKHEEEYKELKNIVEGIQHNLVEVIVPWDASREYQIYSIVEYQGQNYIAIQNVPVGAMITDTGYWTPSNTIIAQINAIGNVVNDMRYNSYKIYENVADMKADTYITDGEHIDTLGYYAENDGGAVSYFITATEPAGYYELLDNGLYAEMIVPDTVTPEMFGAVGDGVTDDTTAMLKAAETSNVLSLGKGKTYLIYEGPVMPEGFTMEMNGATVITDTITDVYTNSWKNFKTTDINVLEYAGAGNITIKNGTFSGQQILLMHSHDVLLDNVDFVDSYGHTIQLAGVCDSTIRNCRFIGSIQNGLEAINFDQAESSGFPYLDPSATAFDKTPEFNVVIDGCEFRPNADNAAKNYMDSAIGNHNTTLNAKYHKKIRIVNNNIHSTLTHGIGMFGFHESEVCNNIILVDAGYPIEFGGCSNVSFMNNSLGCETGGSSAAAFYQRIARSYAISILGNVLIKTEPAKMYDSDNLLISFKALQKIRLTNEAGGLAYHLPSGLHVGDFTKLYLGFNSASNGTFNTHMINGFQNFFGVGQQYGFVDTVMTGAKLTITDDTTITISATQNVQAIRCVDIEK